jgi:hypothetical protein
MAQHKWHKEIKAWADGAEIEYRNIKDIEWNLSHTPHWWNVVIEYRIKPQPKEPQYLYAYKVNAKIVELYDELQMGWDGKMLLGKIKLEWDND